MTARAQTHAEEIANSITHGAGAVAGLAVLAVLVTFAAFTGDPWRIVSVSVYGVSIVLLFTASALYHGAVAPGRKRFFQLLDHAAIFLLIAGTYTPFTLVTFRGTLGWTVFGVVWGIAALGITLTVFFVGRFRLLFLALYLAMGWIIVLAVKPMMAVLPPGGLAWVVAGGLCYTVGVVFYLWRGLRFGHTIWHLFVLAGSACHFMGILFYVVPPRAV